METAPDAVTRVRPGHPVDLRATLGGLRKGAGDPTWRMLPGGFVKAWRTPGGDVVARFVEDRAAGEIAVQGWGPGAEWLCEAAPRVLGRDDDPSEFVAHHPQVAEAARRFPGWRVPATGLVMEALVPTIIEQLVTGKEAFAGYRYLVHRHGSPAPGPFDLKVAPTPREWSLVPSWEWARAGVDGSRAETVLRATSRAGRLEECATMPLADAHRRLRAIRGIGVWTSAEVAQVALGDADAVSFGDYHVAANIGWALTGTPVDDDALAELLEPYAGHRYRVQKLLALAGYMRPRRGPRMTIRSHTPSVARSSRRR
ncbi:MAG: DNA-3-methyladenine glycosylase 2 family protein [Mobilicoccus sp.]|nr:DNA-3-methyladenine glycosylase 2 family protein [Mobilicoccus sp.]